MQCRRHRGEEAASVGQAQKQIPPPAKIGGSVNVYMGGGTRAYHSMDKMKDEYGLGVRTLPMMSCRLEINMDIWFRRDKRTNEIRRPGFRLGVQCGMYTCMISGGYDR